MKRSEYAALTPLDWATYRRWIRYIVPFYAACAGGLWVVAIAARSESSPPNSLSAASTANDHRTDPAISHGASPRHLEAPASRN